jgi:hypothetical protein
MHPHLGLNIVHFTAISSDRLMKSDEYCPVTSFLLVSRKIAQHNQHRIRRSSTITDDCHLVTVLQHFLNEHAAFSADQFWFRVLYITPKHQALCTDQIGHFPYMR